MNLFVMTNDPVECAQMLDNSRVINQIRECGQMLATALRKHGYDSDDIPKTAHPNHPVTKWVCENRGNYMWTMAHMHALCVEKRLRFPNNEPHAYEDLVATFRSERLLLPPGKRQPFVNCARRKDLDIDFTHITNVHGAYRLYMVERWITDKREPHFSNRQPPNMYWDAMEKRSALADR